MQKYELRQRVQEENLVRFETEAGKHMQVDWADLLLKCADHTVPRLQGKWRDLTTICFTVSIMHSE